METTPNAQEKKGKLGKWTPKRWKADYDRVVGYHVMGKQNLEIAKILSFTPEHVSTILNLPQAQELKLKLEAKLREKMEVNIPETLDYVARKTADLMKKVVDNEQLFEKSPFAVIGMGMDVMKGLNHLKGGGNGSNGPINVERAIIVSGAAGSQLVEGFTKADEARRINASPVTIIDGPNERAG
jgi:hypothetical protein